MVVCSRSQAKPRSRWYCSSDSSTPARSPLPQDADGTTLSGFEQLTELVLGVSSGDFFHAATIDISSIRDNLPLPLCANTQSNSS